MDNRTLVLVGIEPTLIVSLYCELAWKHGCPEYGTARRTETVIFSRCKKIIHFLTKIYSTSWRIFGRDIEKNYQCSFLIFFTLNQELLPDGYCRAIRQ
jgi:hypothetical protein